MLFAVFDTHLVLISIDCLQFLMLLAEIQVTTEHMLQCTQIRCPRGSDGFVEQVSVSVRNPLTAWMHMRAFTVCP